VTLLARYPARLVIASSSGIPGKDYEDYAASGAVAINSVGFNIACSVGPAIGGAIVVAAGATLNLRAPA
jgi:hypothetical protein